MSKAKTLCVIDMQPEFGTHEVALPNVIKEIKRAMKAKLGIVVLEYNHCGRTVEPIRKLLSQYKKKGYVTKECDGGGDEFIDVCELKNFDSSAVRFCGVNRSYCVADTIWQVRSHHTKNGIEPQLEVAIKATWCSIPDSGKAILKRIATLV